MTTPLGVQSSTDRADELLPRLASARQRGISWLTDRIDDHGRPEGSAEANSWWRAPWALAIAGAPDAAAAMIGWIEREALTDEGDLRAGPFGGDGPSTSVYQLSPIAIASWLLARYDTARAGMDRLEHWTDPESGGAWEYQDHHTNPLQDTLKTAQLGISSLITGRTDTSDGVYKWLRRVWDLQPELAEKRYYPSSRAGSIVQEFPEQERLLRLVDFTKPKQLYFHTGIAGAFLAGYAEQTGDTDALELGDRFLALNREGCDAQFDDRTSVQICKFGWGAAWMHNAAPESGQLPWVVRMGEWFVDRQRPDGAWAPSSFMNPAKAPNLHELYWKTSEHLMELSYIEQCLRASSSR